VVTGELPRERPYEGATLDPTARARPTQIRPETP
jgi:hypothetical protein